MTYLDAGARLRPTDEAQAGRKRWIPPLVYRRLPWWAELAIIVVGYAVYTRSRVAAPTKERTAYFHASQVWDLERLLHIDVELAINQVTASWHLLGNIVGYYYGTLHFVVTPAVLIWLYFRRPQSYPRLRSVIMIATAAALVTYWTWPLAPPRFALAGATDVLAQNNILGAGDPQGVTSMVNLFAAMPSLHVGWSVWCALAVYVTTSGRWRKLVWLYPAATTFVVVATANHYLLDAVGGVAIVALGMFLTRPVVAVKVKPLPPRESIVTGAPASSLRYHDPIPSPTDEEIGLVAEVHAEIPEDGADGGMIIDVRRSSASPPSTDR